MIPTCIDVKDEMFPHGSVIPRSFHFRSIISFINLEKLRNAGMTYLNRWLCKILSRHLYRIEYAMELLIMNINRVFVRNFVNECI